MVTVENFKYVADELSSIEKWCEDNSEFTYDEMEYRLWDRFVKLRDFAKQANIPFVVTLSSIISSHCAEDDYEEESSSYYEEPDSSYYEEPEEEESNYDDSDY